METFGSGLLVADAPRLPVLPEVRSPSLEQIVNALAEYHVRCSQFDVAADAHRDNQRRLSEARHPVSSLLTSTIAQVSRSQFEDSQAHALAEFERLERAFREVEAECSAWETGRNRSDGRVSGDAFQAVSSLRASLDSGREQLAEARRRLIAAADYEMPVQRPERSDSESSDDGSGGRGVGQLPLLPRRRADGPRPDAAAHSREASSSTVTHEGRKHTGHHKRHARNPARSK